MPTSEFDTVMAEEWEVSMDNAGVIRAVGGGCVGDFDMSDNADHVLATEVARAAIACLGKRALALVLKHEWGNVVEDEWDILATCSECDASHKVPPAVHVEDVDRSGWTHKSDCAWGAIVAEVRKMRETT